MFTPEQAKNRHPARPTNIDLAIHDHGNGKLHGATRIVTVVLTIARVKDPSQVPRVVRLQDGVPLAAAAWLQCPKDAFVVAVG